MNAANANRLTRKALVVGFVSGILCLGACMRPADPPKTNPPTTVQGPPLFSTWPPAKPDLAIVVTGEQQSYLKFCGCSVPQYGGYERRANFINQLKGKGWPVVGIDLGDLVYRKTGSVQAQTLLKYKTSMEALDQLGYLAIGLGEHEFNLPLLDGLTQYTLQKPGANPRIIAANLLNRDRDFPSGNGKGSMIGDLVIRKGQGTEPTLGVLAIVGPTVQQNIADPTLKFADENKKVIDTALEAFSKSEVVVRVLLYQGTIQEATNLANAIDKFHLIICKSPQEEPQDQPVMVGNTMIAMTGWKGRWVGIAGIFRDPQNPRKFALHWDKALMSDVYETPEAQVAEHPTIKLLEEYSKQVRDQNLILQYPKTPHPLQVKYPAQKVSFVGSQTCMACHAAEFKVWQGSRHSHAFDTLVKTAKKPSLRQHDGECVGCHVMGFGSNIGFKSEQSTPTLRHVGCENCHGPGSLHVAQPMNKTYYADLSPWKTKPTDRLTLPDGKYDTQILLKIDPMCQKCHDGDNDPHFHFEEYWPKIAHGKKAAPAAEKTEATTKKQ